MGHITILSAGVGPKILGFRHILRACHTLTMHIHNLAGAVTLPHTSSHHTYGRLMERFDYVIDRESYMDM